MPITGPFDGFHATQASVSKTCLVRFDNNKYPVASRAIGRPVEIHAYADRIVIRPDGIYGEGWAIKQAGWNPAGLLLQKA